MANLIYELAALVCVNEREIRRRIENALGLLLGVSTAFQQSGGHHDHQVGERPTVGLATPDGPDPWEALMNRLRHVNVGMIAVIAIVYAILMYLLVRWLFA